MKDTILCPVCGSDSLEALSEKRSHQLTLGDEFYFMEHVYKCQTCGEEGDFGNRNDKTFEVAESEALKRLVPKLIESFSKDNISMAQFERAFELPQRTVTRWKSGDFSATSIALLRVVKTYPFIVSVAENKFDSGIAKRSLFAEAVKMFGEMVSSSEGSVKVVLSSDAEGVSVNANTYIPHAKVEISMPQLKAVGNG